MGVHDSLEDYRIWSGGIQFPRVQVGALVPKGIPNSLGNFIQGCLIPREDEFPACTQITSAVVGVVRDETKTTSEWTDTNPAVCSQGS